MRRFKSNLSFFHSIKMAIVNYNGNYFQVMIGLVNIILCSLKEKCCLFTIRLVACACHIIQLVATNFYRITLQTKTYFCSYVCFTSISNTQRIDHCLFVWSV